MILLLIKESNQLRIKAASNLSAGTYGYTASVRDIHGFRTSSVSRDITITQAGVGTISSQSIFHIDASYCFFLTILYNKWFIKYFYA